MSRLFAPATAVLMALNSAVTVWGVAVAFLRDAPHVVARTGAFIAAVTGLFVIWQVVEELRMERLKEGSPPVSSDDDDEPGLAGVDRTARRLERAAEHRRQSRLRQARLTMVVVIAVWLSVGEVLHGFGDVLFEYAWKGTSGVRDQLSQVGRHAGDRAAPVSADR